MTEGQSLAPENAKDITLSISGPTNTSWNAQYKSKLECGNWQIQQLNSC